MDSGATSNSDFSAVERLDEGRRARSRRGLAHPALHSPLQVCVPNLTFATGLGLENFP
jgi:hypothetical protein